MILRWAITCMFLLSKLPVQLVYVAYCSLANYIVASLRVIFQYFYLRSSALQSIFNFRLCDHTFSLHEKESTNIVELATSVGIKVETHNVATVDGYILGLHRLKSVGIEQDENTLQPILLLHGTMQDAESFICCGNKSLAAVLSHCNYDVWLGNTRGTKYSNQHKTLDSQAAYYWDFSLDDLAQFDFPAMVNYVLSVTNSSNLIIIGFSQGCAVTVLGLSLHPQLSEKIKVFVALSAPIRPKSNGQTILHSFSRFNYILFAYFFKLLFGEKSIASSAMFFKNLLSRKLFCYIMSLGGYLLVGWRFNNISFHRRKDLFQYTLSEISVKCGLHWIQFDNLKYLQYYHHHIFPSTVNRTAISLVQFYIHKFSGIDIFSLPLMQHLGQLLGGNKFHHAYHDPKTSKLHEFTCDLNSIQCPVVSICGSRDGLVDPLALQDLIPHQVVYNQVEEGYEHLDIIWADTAYSKIFTNIVAVLSNI